MESKPFAAILRNKDRYNAANAAILFLLPEDSRSPYIHNLWEPAPPKTGGWLGKQQPPRDESVIAFGHEATNKLFRSWCEKGTADVNVWLAVM
jgi:hypothetical protein